MKIMTEVPTDLKGLIGALKSQRQIDMEGDEVGVSRQAVDEVVQFLERYAAAPEVKDEPVAFARMYDGEVMVDGVSVFADTAQRELDRLNAEYPDDADRREIVPLYRCPPEVEALKAEIERLRNLLNEAALHLQACKDRGT